MANDKADLGDLDDLPSTISPLLIIRDRVLREEWVICAHRYGKWVPLHPKYFPVCGTYQECMDRVRIKLGSDPVWKKRWWGWSFVGARFDGSVENR